MGRALCKLCATKYLGKAFLCQCICVSSLCAKAFCPRWFLCKRLLSDNKSFLACRAAEMSWDELQGDEKGWSVLGWDENVEKNLLRWHVRRDGMRWEEVRWGEKRWDEVTRAHMIWDEMKCRVWSASVKCEVRGVKSEVWSVKKVFAWRCVAPGSRAGHVLRQAPCNTKHARTGLAGARGMQIL